MARKKAVPFAGKETEAEEALEHKVLAKGSKRGGKRKGRKTKRKMR